MQRCSYASTARRFCAESRKRTQSRWPSASKHVTILFPRRKLLQYWQEFLVNLLDSERLHAALTANRATEQVKLFLGSNLGFHCRLTVFQHCIHSIRRQFLPPAETSKNDQICSEVTTYGRGRSPGSRWRWRPTACAASY